MDNDVSTILTEQADRLFQTHVTKASLSAADDGQWPAALWSAIEDAGLPLALVAEDRGGIGLSAVDALRLVRRGAYHAAPVPLADAMLAQALWTQAGGEAVSGPLVMAPTQPGETVRLEDGRLFGAAGRVPWGTAAGLLVRAVDAGGAVFLAHVAAAPGRVRRNLAYEPRADLIFAGTLTLTLRPTDLTEDQWLAHGAAVRAQQMIGAMERALDHALTHANDRIQFGKPIGKFQAVQHMLAIAAGQSAAATAAADLAAEAWGTDGFAVAAAVAKARAGEAAGEVAAIAHQIHAAMGYTQEHPLHFVTRRLWSWRDEFGHEPYWQAALGRLVCAAGGEALWPWLTAL